MPLIRVTYEQLDSIMIDELKDIAIDRTPGGVITDEERDAAITLLKYYMIDSDFNAWVYKNAIKV